MMVWDAKAIRYANGLPPLPEPVVAPMREAVADRDLGVRLLAELFVENPEQASRLYDEAKRRGRL